MLVRACLKSGILALQTPKFYLAGSIEPKVRRARKPGFLQSIDRKNPQVEQALRCGGKRRRVDFLRRVLRAVRSAPVTALICQALASLALSACAGGPAPVSVDFAVPWRIEVPAGQLSWLPLYDENGVRIEGVELFAGKNAGPPLEFQAIRVDLANPHLAVAVGPRSEKPGVVASIKVSSFARDYDCIAAINANPFSPSSAREGQERTVTGLAVSDGKLISPPDPRYDALVFFAPDAPPDEGGRRAAVLNQREAFEDARQVINAAGGFYTVLKNGEPSEAALSQRGRVRHPRSAAGLSADGKSLVLLVIDGRRKDSVGADEEETALILKRLGAADGLCFDGGGSSALALGPGASFRPGDAGKTARVLNRPVHIFPGNERAVAVCLGIVVR
jgi:hypothetical protein